MCNSVTSLNKVFECSVYKLFHHKGSSLNGNHLIYGCICLVLKRGLLSNPLTSVVKPELEIISFSQRIVLTDELI